MSKKRAIALHVADLHAASHYAPWPEKSKRAASTYLNECWAHFCLNCPEVDYLFLPGDLIDGGQHKSKGTGVFTTQLAEQADGAIELLRPIVKKVLKGIFRLDGTPYHESFDNPLDALDKEFHIPKQHVGQVLDVDLLGDGRLLNVAHHPCSGSTIYMGTSVDKEALWSIIAHGMGKVHACRWIVRGHKHSFMIQEQEGKTVCLLPGWQAATPWAKKVNYWRFQPSIGGALMVKDDWQPGELRFVPMTYKMPASQPIRVGGR
jgi:hypothetical protein